MMKTIVDNENHRWPVTGLWCTVCGMPLHLSQAHRGTHTNCDPTPDQEDHA